VVSLLRVAAAGPTAAEGATASPEFGSRSMAQLWQCMRPAERMELFRKLQSEGADELRRLKSTGQGEGQARGGEGEDMDPEKCRCMVEHLVCRNIASTRPEEALGSREEPVGLESFVTSDGVGEALLEAICMCRLARYTPETARVIGRLKKAVELWWADENAGKLLEEERYILSAKEAEKSKKKGKKKKKKVRKNARLFLSMLLLVGGSSTDRDI
jgi:hypothetical protein